MKIVVGINSLVSTTHAAYGNHIQLFYNLGKLYSDVTFILVNPPRMSIDRMRNMTAEIALQKEADYILFIDDDVIVPLDNNCDFLRKMMAHSADAIAGDVLIRGYPFKHMVFKYDERKNLNALERLESDEVTEVDAVGFSLCLIKVATLKKMEKPYFITGLHNTEDIFFCMNLKEEIQDAKILVDPSIKCGHILWDEVIYPDNLTNYKEYYEKQYKIAKNEVNPDRGDIYLQQVKKRLEEGVVQDG